ncbi:hypothetical protein [Accumulibacter sp.]|uniref:hypothetical protein n=1 Tax=Accumulibacter sp. TaxID=2053492 RepID=UPI0025F5DAEA|nr:hypothetical protein [Accumulibacter sp.]MCM8625161.1 hypothetical protein [Accumulibacter sp.]
MAPKYPNITVRLSGRDSNAFMILGLCQRAAKDAGLPKEEIDAFYKEATSGDHDHLIQTAMRWFSCA